MSCEGGAGGGASASASNTGAWGSCAIWLLNIGVLGADHPCLRGLIPVTSTSIDSNNIYGNGNGIQQLAVTLRDGVLLCHLLNSLYPNSVDLRDVNQRPQMAQFLCLRNIRVFLRTCQEKFHLKDADLFEPSMLFDLSNFHRVLCTLAKLSQSPKALAKNIPSFSIQQTSSQEDIYKDLQSLDSADAESLALISKSDDSNTGTFECSSNVGYNDLPWVHFKIPNVMPTEEMVEAIYEDLCYVKIGTAQQEFTLSSHSLEKRDYVIRELVDTESNYVDMLVKIEKYFIRPLSSVMRSCDMQTIFYGIKELFDTHSGFLTLLQQATAADFGSVQAGQPAPKLGETFLAWREKFLIYGDYCNNLTTAQKTLEELCKKDENFMEKLNKCQKEHSDNRIQLRDILPVPMQRILKYHLILDKLVQETQPNHEEFRSLERAKEAMVDVAQYINEMIRDSGELQLLNNIQDSIQDWELPSGTKLADYGRLLYDGELRVKAHDDQKLRSRYVFAFDKVMVFCKAVKENKYSYRSVLRLCEWRVEIDTGRRSDSGGRWSAKWLLVRKPRDTALTLYARTDEVRRRWISTISEALDNMEPAGCRSTDHKFIHHTFEKPVTCQHCSKFLKGRIFQGYQCNVCGTSVHKNCIPLSGRCGAVPPTPPPPLPPVLTLAPDHMLHYYMWFVGEMGREVATSRLERRVDGTFLLRIRPQPSSGPHDTPFALSLKTDNTVKHMRVCQRPIDSVQHYFLSESRFFRSVVELVSYYEKTTLGENFVGLNVVLKWPFRRLVATATHDFRPSDSSQLPLRIGTKVLVLSKEGDSRGWWKGRNLEVNVEQQSGYFPKECVREDPEFMGNLD